jgi:hypothetical protein
MTLPSTTQTWTPADNILYGSAPGSIDTVQKHPVGYIGTFKDPNYGTAKFIYLLGVANTVAGDAVSYNGATGATTRAAAGNGIPWTIAFATAATVASTWGWYQVTGRAVANKTKTVSFTAGLAVGISTTALIALSSSLKELQNAWVAVVASAASTNISGDKIILNINYPHLQGRFS